MMMMMRLRLQLPVPVITVFLILPGSCVALQSSSPAKPPSSTMSSVEAAITLTSAFMESSDAARAALESSDPVRARPSLFARAVPNSRAGGSYFVMNESAGGGEVVLKLSRTPARARAAALLRAAAPPGVFAAALVDDGSRAALLERLAAPLAVLRAELAAGILFPVLARALADALAPLAFTTSVWAQSRSEAASTLVNALGAGGELGSAARAEAETTLSAMFDAPFARADVAPLRDAVRAPLSRARVRAAEAAEGVIHGELSTARILVGLVPVAALPLANSEAFRPDEYPDSAVGGKAGDAGGWASVPARAVVGSLRLTGGGGARLGALGIDVGVLLADLLRALLFSSARARAETIAGAKGGYAAFSTRSRAARWLDHGRALSLAVVDFWAQWTRVFIAEWDADLARADGAVQREPDGCPPPDVDPAVAAHWNCAPQVTAGATQKAFLVGVGEDALSFAGVALADSEPDTHPEERAARGVLAALLLRGAARAAAERPFFEIFSFATEAATAAWNASINTHDFDTALASAEDTLAKK